MNNAAQLQAEIERLQKSVEKQALELESKNRELEIEAALEHVRAASMATHKSEELQKVVSVLFEQLQSLNFALDGAAAFIATKVENFRGFDFWLEDKVTQPARFRLPYYDAPSINDLINAWEKRKDFLVKIYGKEKNIWFKYAFEHTDLKIVPEDRKKWVLAQSHLTQAIALQENSMVGFHAHHEKSLTDSEIDILKRFSKVFEQSFVRFLDLQKAEAQAREAQIEAALEKVRSRSLAMHRSDELKEVVSVLFEKLKDLQIPFTAVGIATNIEGSKDLNAFVCGQNDAGLVITNYRLPYFDNPVPRDLYHALEKQLDFFVGHYSKAEKDAFYNYVIEQTAEFKHLPEDILSMIFESPTYSISMAAVKNAVFNINDFEGKALAEYEIDIIKRFARVFDQAYTRFLDLQKAEAQAREAQIEAALERVRSRTMTMQSSDELSEAATEMFSQIKGLGLNPWSCGFNIFNHDKTVISQWVSSGDGRPIEPFDTPTTKDVFKQIVDHSEHDELLYIQKMEGKKLEDTYKYMASLPTLDKIFEELDAAGIELPKKQVDHVAYFKHGYLMFITYEETPEFHSIFKRFAKVFEQTYTRFLDLQKAEARAKESQIETALERVRSRTMGMQQSEELGEVATVLFNEMNGLVDDLWTCGFVLCEENRKEDEWWLSMEDGFTRGFFLPNVGDFAHETLYEGWEKGESFRSVQLEGKELDAHYDWLMKIPIAKQIFAEMEASGIPRPKWQKLHAAYFKTGYLVIITEVPCAEEEIFKRFAQVFDLTYTRFLDLQEKEEQGKKLVEEKLRLELTLKDLRATQAQLIQSEKMASLGELTAGIAHEIQNPLNFVNNFSEVSGELIDEMNEELEKGEIEEAKFIAADLKENLSKINHHGKRADAIVKGMLEHSRANKGEKAPTDLNALADEFVRLSYHGLRAKDKSFNADFKLELDPNLPKVNVVASDIGRVILNLVNNAFYAVHEKAKSTPQPPEGGEGYKPEVTVKTTMTKSPSEPVPNSREDLGVEISVQDNGPGIPEHIKEKIFQPFFTTKPTGSGTGLGLSLSYDIVKAHGGELRVQSDETIGTKFILTLNT